MTQPAALSLEAGALTSAAMHPQRVSVHWFGSNFSSEPTTNKQGIHSYKEIFLLNASVRFDEHSYMMQMETGAFNVYSWIEGHLLWQTSASTSETNSPAGPISELEKTNCLNAIRGLSRPIRFAPLSRDPFVDHRTNIPFYDMPVMHFKVTNTKDIYGYTKSSPRMSAITDRKVIPQYIKNLMERQYG